MVSRILVDCTMSREWDLNYNIALLYKITTDGLWTLEIPSSAD